MTLAVTMPRGTTHDIKVTITAKDLTGAAAYFTMTTAHGAANSLTKLSSNGGISVTYSAITNNSLVNVHLLPVNTGTLAIMQYQWQLAVVLAGVEEIIEDGTITLTANDLYAIIHP